MPSLFETTKINSLEMPNRFIRSATWLSMADEFGACTPQLTAEHIRLAKANIGLIIAGFSFISPEGKGPKDMTGIYNDEIAESFRGMIRDVHEAGGRIAAQIAHCGARSRPTFGDLTVRGPSRVLKDDGSVEAEEMDIETVQRIQNDFAAAVVRCREIGYDAIQLHYAHGYLGNQFLSPFYNKRTDQYGGSLENRTRFLIEVYNKVRNAAGDDYPIMAKLNSEDFVDGGLELSDGIYAARRLAEAGLDLLEVSGGTVHSGRKGPARFIRSPADEMYLRNNALAIKKALIEGTNIPVAVVGGIRRLEDAHRLIEEDGLDYVSLCRPLICEPELIQRWIAGDTRPGLCKSCSRCFKTFEDGRGIYCAVMEGQ